MKGQLATRKLFILTLSFAAGICLAEICAFPLAGWLLLALVSLTLVVFSILAGYKSTIFLLAGFTIAGAFWYSLDQLPGSLNQEWVGQDVAGTGLILTYPRVSGDYVSCIVRVEGLEIPELVITGRELPDHQLTARQGSGVEKLLLRLPLPPEDEELLPGMKINFRGSLVLPRESRNPGEFDYRIYLARQGVFFQLKGREFDLAGDEEGFRVKIARFRQKIAEQLPKVLPPRESALLMGLLFGDTGGMKAGEWEGYQRAGVVHLFAVSGFHVSLVLGVAWFFLSYLRLGPAVRLVWGSGLLLSYVFLVGWSPSIVRASVMAVTGMSALVVGKKKDFYTSLSLAALFILVSNPGQLFTAGFQLSFAATWGLVYLTPRLENWGLGKFLGVAVAAQLASLPLTAYHFNQVSLVGPLVNVVAVLAGAGVTVVALAGCIALAFSPLLATPFFLAAGALGYLLSSFVLWWGGLEWSSLVVSTPTLLQILLYYLFLLALPQVQLFLPALRSLPYRIKVGAGVVVVLVLLLAWYPGPSRMQVVFLDVGQGDCIFIKTPEGFTALVDGGGTPGSDYSVGRQVLLPFLHRKGLGKIDAVFMTHQDLDHSEGLLEILPYMKMGAFFMPPREGSEIEEKISKACREQGAPVRELVRGQVLRLGSDVTLEVLHPQSNVEASGNNRSLVILLRYGQSRWLLTGDVEGEALQELKKRANLLEADVLKIPHHGGLSSYDEDFYGAVKPQAVVVSVGVNNYGHPHSQVMAYFLEKGIPCLVTKDRGAVITESDGQKIRIRTHL